MKVRVFSFRVLLPFGLILAPVSLASTSGSLTLTGFVPEHHSVSVSTTQVTVLAAFDSAASDPSYPDTSLEVARIVETSNQSFGGQSVSIRSHNGGLLQRAANDEGSSIAYELSYNAQPVNLKRGEARFDSSSHDARPHTTVHVLAVRAASPSALSTAARSGASDTLTFSIAAH